MHKIDQRPDPANRNTDFDLLIAKFFEQIGYASRKIAIWKSAETINNLNEDDRRSYEAAIWEGWPLLP